MCFSERLVKLRKFRGMTQNELAKKAGITTRALQNYELGIRVPKDEYVFKLALALEISVNALQNDNECELIISNLSNTDKDNISAYASALCGSIAASSIPLILSSSSLLFPAIPFIFGGGMLVANLKIKKAKKVTDIMNELYKEQAKINATTLLLNERYYSLRDKYEQIALKMKQNEDNIEYYKDFIKLTQNLSAYQEYQILLKQKCELCTLLMNEIKKNHHKESELFKKIMSEIREIEIKEERYKSILQDDILNLNKGGVTNN